MEISKCRWRFRHWFWLPVLVTGSLPVPQDSTADLLGGPLPVDGSDGVDDIVGEDISSSVSVVNATLRGTEGIISEPEFDPEGSEHLSSSSSSSASASTTAAQFLGNKAPAGTTAAPAVSEDTGDDGDHTVQEAGDGVNQHSNGTVMEQMLRVQLAALRQENQALHAALSHSTASAASLDAELAKAENKRAEAESAMQHAVNESNLDDAELIAMAHKLQVSEARRVAQLNQAQSEKHSLEVNLTVTQNQTLETQTRLQAAIDSSKAALTAAEKQEAALTVGLKKATIGEEKYHSKMVEIVKSVGQLKQINAHLHTLLRQRTQQLHKSETLRLRAEGALDHADKAVTKLAKRTGSEQWFEEQVASLRAGLDNATRDAKFARESRDAEQSLLEAADRDRKTLKSKLTALNKSDELHAHWLTAALAESKAQTSHAEGNASGAWHVLEQLRSTLKEQEKRREAAEGAAQQSVNRSSVIKQFADTEVQRAVKERDDAEMAAGKAVTRAETAESQVGALNRDLQAVKVDRDELKTQQKQELQSAQDLAAEVQRLRADLADSKTRLARSEQHAATLQAQFDAVGDLEVPKVANGTTSLGSDAGKKYSKKDTKQRRSSKDRMRLSLSLLERSNTEVDLASSQAQENNDQEVKPDRAAVMKGDADRLQALLK